MSDIGFWFFISIWIVCCYVNSDAEDARLHEMEMAKLKCEEVIEK